MGGKASIECICLSNATASSKAAGIHADVEDTCSFYLQDARRQWGDKLILLSHAPIDEHVEVKELTTVKAPMQTKYIFTS